MPTYKFMRLLDLAGPEGDEFEALLRGMADRNDRLESAEGRKLLDLVQYLRSRGPAPLAFASVCGRELWLRPASPARVLVRVWMDSKDYAPRRDDLPEMHYRLQIQREASNLSKDARVRSPEEVDRLVREAFGWSAE